MDPLSWKKPRMVFVCSMGDLFHEDVDTSYILSVFEIMGKTPQHTYQILTKRPRRMKELHRWIPRNCWLGVSCESQAAANKRIPVLLSIPCSLRFISCEPLLGSILLNEWLCPGHRLDWVVVGGESGPRARPCGVDWIESIADQCKSAGVPYFVKQLGADPRWAFAKSSPIAHGRGKNGAMELWPESLRVREYPNRREE